MDGEVKNILNYNYKWKDISAKPVLLNKNITIFYILILLRGVLNGRTS